MITKTKILDKTSVNHKLKRLAWEIYEHNASEKEIIFVGISTRGLEIAKRLSKHIYSISKIRVILGKLNLDKKNPYNKDVKLDLKYKDYKDKVVILCDDVLNSGKTLMYSAKPFLNVPLLKLSVVVLVDRNHNRYPIKADYVGLSLATTLQEYVSVDLGGENEGAYLS